MGGEALMHQNLWTLCELLRELDDELQITLLSTGLLLKVFAADVVKWCDEVIVSRIESPFFGMSNMVAFIEDTPERWFKMPVPKTAEVEVQRPS